MTNIIYHSDTVLPWDTQSAFKMTNYHSQCEEHMIFCYFKAYVHNKNLVLCTYVFRAVPNDSEKLSLYIKNGEKVLTVDFNYNGIICAYTKDGIAYDITHSSYTSNDEQGYYWCAQLTFTDNLLAEALGFDACVGGEIKMNLVQHFSEGDFGAVFGDADNEQFDAIKHSQTFTIVDY